MRSALVAMISLATVSATQEAHAEEAPLYTCKEAPAGSKLTASFKPDVALADLVTWVSGFSCKNIVVAPDVAKYATRLSIVSPKAMTPKQALQLFVDAVEATGLVVQQKPDTLVIKLGLNMPKNCPDVATPPTTPTGPADPITDLDAKPDPLIATINKVDDTHFVVPRATVDTLAADPGRLVKGFRIVPSVKDGKPDGIRLYAIRPSAIPGYVGLTNGDTLTAINGAALTSTDAAIDAFTKARTASKLEIQLIRRGKPVTVVITIK